jgi:hypothetical protein
MSTYYEIFAESQGTLLGNGTINGDATMEHVMLRNITNGSSAGSAPIAVMQQQNYY